MLNKDISSAARFSLLGILFLSGANGLMMEIVFRRQLLLSLGVTHYSVATVLTVFMAGLALGSFFLAGFAALSLEVHWTRILAYVVGSHGYAFGIILAAFLCGIALGSTLVSRLVDRLNRPALWLGSTQLLIAGTKKLGQSVGKAYMLNTNGPVFIGGAITTGSVARHPLVQIDAIELCPPVVKAAALFESWNHGVLHDPRLHIILQDGRNHLLTTQKKYDVITADATHPWSADSWILYTREMYRLVRSRLSDEGIFCQWVPLHWMSMADFKCVLRTMRTEFPHMSLWYTGSYVVALGSQKQVRLNLSEFAHRMQQAPIQQDLASVGIDSPESLLGLHLLTEGGIDRFVGAGPLNTDDFAYLEHSASRCFGRETTPENLAALMQARKLPEFLSADNPAEPRAEFQENLLRIFQAREKTIRGRLATYRGNLAESVADYQAALQQAPEDGITKILLTDALRTLASAQANNGDQARRAGKIKEAVAIYTQALDFDPNAPRAHNGLGLINFARGDYPSALRHFDIAVQRYPKQAQIRFNRTLALLKLRRLADARQEVAVIKELEPEGAGVFSAQLQKLMSP